LNNPSEKKRAVFILLLISLLYAALVLSHWDEHYIDFGDGNYLYISARLADGLTLYRDIMAPQPPCHLYLGAALIKLGRALNQPLYTVRAFSLLLRLAAMLLVFLITRKITKRLLDSCLATILYLAVPIGFWWAQGYQSEGLLIFFMLVSFYFFIDLEPRKLWFAALFGTLAAFTNMTAVPYLFLANLFLLVRHRRLMLHYTLPMALMGLAGVLLMEFVSDGFYLRNVFLNQVGTFPKPEISGESVLTYAVRKILNEGKDVLTWEGGYVLFGLTGLAMYILKGDEIDTRREYIGWHAFFSFCSIIYVSKGGTMEYIFTIGEPFAVIFFAHAMGLFWRGTMREGEGWKNISFKDTSRFAAVCVLFMLLFATFYIGALFVRKTLYAESYELPASEVKVVKEIIGQYSREGDAILAPPFYAFITGRRVVEEYSENYIWTIKYVNEVFVDKKPGEGVAKALAISRALKARRVPIVLLDMAQTAKLPPIKEAIDAYYEPLNFRSNSNVLQTLNTRIEIFIPKKK